MVSLKELEDCCSRIRSMILKGLSGYNRGITLVELMITLMLVGILVLTVTPFFRVNLSSYFNIKSEKEMLQSARIGFNRIMAEMQQIEGPVDITYASSARIDFNRPGGGGSVVYEYSGGQLQRQGVKLLGGVQSFIMKYYRADGTEKSTPFSYDSDVWRIQIEMVVENRDKHLHLRGQISPRSFHYQ